MIIGIIGAMEEEISGIKKVLETEKFERIGNTEFIICKFSDNLDVVLTVCGIGKVNAAICAQALIDKYKPDYIINTGVAGGIDPSVNVSDVVVSTDLIEHDFDCRAFGYELGQIPRIKNWKFKADDTLAKKAVSAGEKIGAAMHTGRIISGDIFVNDNDVKQTLYKKFGAKCCEMEGAAIAHTAQENNVPFVVIRSISDKADDDSAGDFDAFVIKACEVSKKLMLELLSSFE